MTTWYTVRDKAPPPPAAPDCTSADGKLYVSFFDKLKTLLGR
jgi:hypothetical protein